MKNVSAAVENEEKWSALAAYVELIDQNIETNTGVAVDGAKSLLESIAKTVLTDRGVEFSADTDFNRLVKDAVKALPSFIVLEKQDADQVLRMVAGVDNLASSIAALRNRHTVIGHGQDIHSERQIDIRLARLVLDSVDGLAGFLMEAHVSEPDGMKRLRYEEFADINERYDSQHEVVEVEGIVISPSRALFDQDIEAYKETVIAYRDKEKLIDDLEISGNFMMTHGIISGLEKYDTFSPAQAARLVQIALENSQVRWIIEDDDVYSFYISLIRNNRDNIDLTLRRRFWSQLESVPPEAVEDMEVEPPPF